MGTAFGESQISSAIVKNFYRIGEVSRLTDTKPFVLRYWETEFPMLQPVKSAKGHRLYRREDVSTVMQIKHLLYDEGFTIAGARRHLRETGSFADTVPVAELSEFQETTAVEDGAAIEEDLEADGATPPAEQMTMAAVAGGSTAGNAPSAEHGFAAPIRRAEPVPTIGRNVLLELRDSLRAFLTLLENE